MSTPTLGTTAAGSDQSTLILSGAQWEQQNNAFTFKLGQVPDLNMSLQYESSDEEDDNKKPDDNRWGVGRRRLWSCSSSGAEGSGTGDGGGLVTGNGTGDGGELVTGKGIGDGELMTRK